MKTTIVLFGVITASLLLMGDLKVVGDDLKPRSAQTVSSDESPVDTNTLKNLFTVSPAYQAAATRQMLQEANFFAQQLKLPEALPITTANANISVNPPRLAGLGSLGTKEFFYSFPGHARQPITNEHGAVWFREHGKLAYVMRKNPFARWDDGKTGDLSALFAKLAVMPSLLDTNTAYQLATQWLASVGVDVAELEKAHPPLSVQQFFSRSQSAAETLASPPADAHQTPLPIFDITWGGPADDTPPVWVQIFGPTKELISLRMEDTRFSKRPPVSVPDAEALNEAVGPSEKAVATNAAAPPLPVLAAAPIQTTNPMFLPEDLSLDANAIRNLSAVSPAYKAAAARQMLQEVNYFARQLKLHESLPITAANAKIITDPLLACGIGSVETKRYSYSFPGSDRPEITNGFGAVWFQERGKLAYIKCQQAYARWDDGTATLDDMAPIFRKLMATPCRLDTNTAYQLATQWLASVSVDVGELEKRYHPLSVQQTFYDQPASSATANPCDLKKLPIFNVTWGGPEDEDSPPIDIHILGPTKELIFLRMEDTRFCKRPPVNIPNAEALNGATTNTP